MKFSEKVFNKLGLITKNNLTRYSTELSLIDPYTLARRGEINKYNNYFDYFGIESEELLGRENYDQLFGEIFQSVDYICQHFAKIDIDIYQNYPKRVKNIDMDLDYMLNIKANEYNTSFEFKYNLMWNLNVYGKCFTWLNPETKEVFILQNNCLLNSNNKNYYVYSNNSNFLNDNLLNVEYMQENESFLIPKNEINVITYNTFGDSPVAKILKEYAIISKIKQGLWKQVNLIGDLSAVIPAKTENSLGNKEANFEYEDFRKKLSSPLSFVYKLAGQFAGETKYFERDKTSKDLGPILKEQRRVISTALGIPAGLVGGDSNQGIDELEKHFYKGKLSTLCKNIEQNLLCWIIDKEAIKSGWKFVIDLEKFDKVQQNQKITNEVLKLNNGIIDLETAQITLGYDPNKIKKEVNNETTKV